MRLSRASEDDDDQEEDDDNQQSQSSYNLRSNFGNGSIMGDSDMRKSPNIRNRDEISVSTRKIKDKKRRISKDRRTYKKIPSFRPTIIRKPHSNDSNASQGRVVSCVGSDNDEKISSANVIISKLSVDKSGNKINSD